MGGGRCGEMRIGGGLGGGAVKGGGRLGSGGQNRTVSTLVVYARTEQKSIVSIA